MAQIRAQLEEARGLIEEAKSEVSKETSLLRCVHVEGGRTGSCPFARSRTCLLVHGWRSLRSREPLWINIDHATLLARHALSGHNAARRVQRAPSTATARVLVAIARDSLRHELA